MTEPNHEKIAEALEKLAEGETRSDAEESAEAGEGNRPPLPATFIAAMPSATVTPEEIVVTEEETTEGDNVEMGEAGGGEAGEGAAGRFSTSLRNRTRRYETMEFRRTIIPILLTCALLTLAFSSLKFATGPDSIFSDLPMWLPVTLMAAGVILLFLAVLNMLAVKHAR